MSRSFFSRMSISVPRTSHALLAGLLVVLSSRLARAQVSETPSESGVIHAALNPADAELLRSQLRSHDFRSAETLLLARISASSSPQLLLEALGEVLFLDRQYLQAAIAYKKAEGYGALSENARFRLAMAYIELNQHKWARDELSALAAAHPRDVRYRYWLGKLSYDAQDFAAALRDFDQAIALDPHWTRAWDSRALCKDALRQFDSAGRDYLRANELNRALSAPDPWPPLDYGVFLGKLGRVADARTLLAESLRIDPSLDKAHYELGRLEEQSNRLDRAISEFETAQRLNPSDPASTYALFRLYRKIGRQQQADAMLTRYRELKSQTVPAR